MNPAPNLVLVGPMGSGKTSIGRRLADRFGLRFVDADHHVEQQSGATISAIFEHVGEAGFRQREAAALAGLLAGERLLVATGGGAVLGEANRRLMRERGFVVYLQAGLESQLKRLHRQAVNARFKARLGAGTAAGAYMLGKHRGYGAAGDAALNDYYG